MNMEQTESRFKHMRSVSTCRLYRCSKNSKMSCSSSSSRLLIHQEQSDSCCHGTCEGAVECKAEAEDKQGHCREQETQLGGCKTMGFCNVQLKTHFLNGPLGDGHT